MILQASSYSKIFQTERKKREKDRKKEKEESTWEVEGGEHEELFDKGNLVFS